MVIFKRLSVSIPGTDRVMSDYVYYTHGKYGTNPVVRYCFEPPKTEDNDVAQISGIRDLNKMKSVDWSNRYNKFCMAVESEKGLISARCLAEEYRSEYFVAVKALKEQNPANEVTSAFSRFVDGLKIEENDTLLVDLSVADLTQYLRGLGFREIDHEIPYIA
ncbi:MAG: hypothetical protein KAJ91_04490 [Candidatus Aenigmarchaeota archaeon]|nr:hypothetical protein [Candidatus Aenigmarchaeota archaeon]